jgi:thymidylate kinase
MDRAFAYAHCRPSLTAPLGHPSPHAIPLAKIGPREDVTPLDQLVSLVRLLRSALAYNALYMTRLRPQLRRGAVVVVDRWIYNYVTQPHSVRYYGPQRLAAFVCCRLVVQPCPVFVMEAPTSVILARSDELSENEIGSEYERLRNQLRLRDLRWIDATGTPTEIASGVLSQCGLTEPQSV